MEGAGGDEQYVVGTHHAVFGRHCATLDEWQQITLHTLT